MHKGLCFNGFLITWDMLQDADHFVAVFLKNDLCVGGTVRLKKNKNKNRLRK